MRAYLKKTWMKSALKFISGNTVSLSCNSNFVSYSDKMILIRKFDKDLGAKTVLFLLL